MTASPEARYAVYYAPAPGSAWWRFGCAWLGRDAVHDLARAMPDVEGVDLRAVTASPRRYGFHATLKAPFRLKPGLRAAHLCQRAAELAGTLVPVSLGALRAGVLGDFVALRPTVDGTLLRQTAQRVVEALDDLRAPPTAVEMARRRAAAPLDARGEALLERWGYPYTEERFRFHITLSDPVDTTTADRLIDAAHHLLEPLNRLHPPTLDRLSVFVEPAPGAPFMRLADFAFRDEASARSGAAR